MYSYENLEHATRLMATLERVKCYRKIETEYRLIKTGDGKEEK